MSNYIFRIPIKVAGIQLGWLRGSIEKPLPAGSRIAFESMDGGNSGLINIPTEAPSTPEHWRDLWRWMLTRWPK